MNASLSPSPKSPPLSYFFLSNPLDGHHARLRRQNQSPSPHAIFIPEAKVSLFRLPFPPSLLPGGGT